jgi:hypothetical protein
MKILYRLPLLVLALLPLCLYAQRTASVSGFIQDKTGRPIAGAAISIMNERDSLLKIAVAGDNGDFIFQQPYPAKYRLAVSAIGFEQYRSDMFSVSGPVQLPVIQLLPAATQLKDVTVTSQKPFIENKIDRMIVNVDALISNAGTNALEVLEKSPGVTVDQEGNISLRGKAGVVIYIDDKPTYMSGADLAGYLRSLPSGTLEAIELIPIPPARYDAAGSAGVINIRTKKLKQRGFNGNLSTGYQQGRYPKSYNSLNLNFRNNAFNFFANAGFNLTRQYNDLEINRSYFEPDGTLSSSFKQENFLRMRQSAPSLRTGVDYYIDKNTTMGVQLNGNFRRTLRLGDNDSYLSNAAGTLDSLVTADNTSRSRNDRMAANIYYRKKFGERELQVDLDYINNNSFGTQYSYNKAYLANGTPSSADDLRGELPSAINIYAAKADYSQPLPLSIKMDGGLKTSYITTDNKASYWRTINNVTAFDYDISNHFRYRENINAAYINFTREGKRLSTQLGLRLENTIMNGHQLGNAEKQDSSFKRSYTQLFPTFYINYKLDSANVNQFTLAYSKRIRRPDFNDLNPFVSPLDKFMLYVGNPYLQPVISNALDLTYVFKEILTVNANYTHNNGEIGETIEARDNKFFSRPGNVGKSDYVSIFTSLNYRYKWFTLIYSGGAEYAWFKGMLYEEELDTEGLVHFGTLTTQFNLGKGWDLELTGNYISKLTTMQFVLGDYWATGGAIRKKILKDKGAIRLSIQDVFHTRLNYGDINHLQNATGSYRNQYDTQLAGLTFTYNFGKSFETRKRGAGSAEQEQERIN